jgi:hypothetical protein
MSATLTKGFMLLATWAVVAGCDTIEMPVPPEVTSSLSAAEQQQLDTREQQLPAPTNVQRAFLEDFTGQFCGNCPRAGAIASQLKNQYGERLVAVEEHETDYFAAPKAYAPYQVDYRVPVVSQEIENAFGLAALPKGAVSRQPLGSASSLVLEYADWGTAVAAQLAKTPQQELRLTPLYDSVTHVLRLKVASRYLVAQPNRKFRLGVFLAEDNLVGGQKDYDQPAGRQDIFDYVHHHVLRAALTGTFGTLQATNPIKDQAYVSYLGYTLPALTSNPAKTQWKAKNVSVVAYLADDATKEIVQTIEVKLL